MTCLRISKKQFRKALSEIEEDRREATMIVEAVKMTPVASVTSAQYEAFLDACDTILRCAAEEDTLRARYAADRALDRALARRRYRKLSTSQKTIIALSIWARGASDGHMLAGEG